MTRVGLGLDPSRRRSRGGVGFDVSIASVVSVASVDAVTSSTSFRDASLGIL